MLYIIDAEEGAEIIYGHKAKTKEELASLIEAGRTFCRKLLLKVTFFVPSNSCMPLVQVSLS